MNNTKKLVWLFLVIGFAAWSFRLVAVFNAHYDAIAMLLISLIIYSNKNH